EIKALEAEIQRASERLRQAEYDLSRCALYAPFTGEVSEVYVEAGGYAKRGEKVARLVMMAPIKVDLAVAPATAARLRRGDIVRLYVGGGSEPVPGSVYEKATTADPETRTFRISIITHNVRMRAPFGPEDPRAALPRIELTMPLTRSGEGFWFVEERRSLREDGRGHFVWADPVAGMGSAPDGTVLHLRKFRVQLGARRRSLQGLYLMRELVDTGGLAENTLIPFDVPESDADELKVVLACVPASWSPCCSRRKRPRPVSTCRWTRSCPSASPAGSSSSRWTATPAAWKCASSAACARTSAWRARASPRAHA
ncbi:MAG: efflux RND transporter periplasmic adaptor subunit, partial [Planctomycetota bacterium]